MPTQSIDLGNTEDVLFNGSVVDKVTLGTASTAASTHQIIWERANYAISGTATYSPYTKEVTYAVTLAHVTSWTYEAVRQGDNASTGVQGPYTQLSVGSGVLGTPQDGTWDVTFKGYTGTTHRVTATTTVTVATPTIEITSVVHTHTFANIITTNLDLPDEPEPDEFKGNDPFSEPASYEWYDYAADAGYNSYYPRDRNTTYRGSWVRYKLDSTESAVNNFEAYDDAYIRHNVVFEEQPSGTDDIFVHLTGGHSIFGANRRYYTKRIIDLWFTDGVYAPMSDDIIGGGNYFQGHHAFLTQRIGNESEYAVSLPIYKEDGTKERDLKVFDTFPAPPNGSYRMTFDGFDMDLWQHGTTMRPGFKNPQAPNGYQLSDLGRNVNYYISETLSGTGKFFEDPTDPNGYGMHGGKELAAMENYDHLALDGYMYYKGELKMTRSEALALNPNLSNNARNSFNKDSLTDENAIWTRNGSSSEYRTFRRTVARKALSSDHTVQTVIDALKERRSNRTVTGVMAHNGYHTMHIDGAVKKFQSGEWYYPSNSPMYGKNYSAITATAPYFAENLQGYYYAKNFTIGST